MGRSIKKGPFVAPELIKRRSSRPGPALPRSSPSSSVTPSQYTMAASMFRYMLPRTWLVTSWASLLPPVPTRVTRAARPPITASKEELK